MRVLFTTLPGAGHVLPLAPLAWALRAAGHEVLWVTAANTADPVRMAGLPGVQIRPETAHQTPTRPTTSSATADILRTFTDVSMAMTDGVIRVGQAWQPDLVVHEPLHGTGPLLAGKLGVPAVEHNLGLERHPGTAMAIYEYLRPAYHRHGVAGPPVSAAALDVAPPSMAIGEPVGRPMRYVPFDGGGTLPPELVTAPRRPRIAVTVGTTLEREQGPSLLRAIARTARHVPAQYVLALGGTDPTVIEPLPDNVRVARWLPLPALLATCSGIVHHGGAGTTLTALTCGVPQLVLPQRGDQFANAAAVSQRGLGLQHHEPHPDADLFHRLLDDTALHTAAHEVRTEIARMPAPTDLLAMLNALNSA
jgi:UDP:flavonoid glycosyltransferase YjiC (YdhE family)